MQLLKEHRPIRGYLMLLFFAFAISVLSMLLFVPSLEPTAERWYSQAILSSASFAQGNFTVESLFIALTSDGDAIIEYDVRLPKTQLQRTNITLIGNTINDLGVSDYQHNPLLYRLNEKTREASINSSGATHLLITYSSSDLVDKRDRVWTFSVDSPVIFSLKMPPESQIVKLGGNNSTSSVSRILQQDLLTFTPGNSQISYIIGPQGTNDESNAVIKSAELSIKDARNNLPGIILTDSQNLLQQAAVSKLNGRNLDAAKKAIESNNMIQSTIEDYKLSQDTINKAEKELAKLLKTGNKYHSESLLSEANAHFRRGQYDLARLSAEDIIIKLTQSRETSSGKPTQSAALNDDNDEIYLRTILIYVLAALTILFLGILLLVRKKLYRICLLRISSMLPYLRTYFGGRYNRSNQLDDRLLPGSRSLIPWNSSSLSDPSAAPNNSSSQSVRSNEPALAASSSGPSFSSASNSSFSSSQDRTSLLNQVIKQKLSERPHLRLEDEQLLKLLAKKQGAAFESEIRNNLLLPKTSVWRLVRRLEREELIKVVKVDNQNLIRLKV